MSDLKIFLAAGTAALVTLLLPGPVAAIPPIQHWLTENGARVYFVVVSGLPMVDVQLAFDAGSARDGAKFGLAELTNTLLNSGTADLSADAVADRLDGVGAQLSGGVQRDMAWLYLRSLSDPAYLTLALDTVARLLREPTFEPTSFARERNRMIAAVRERAQSPAEIGEETFYKSVYGDHPYASPPDGDEATLHGITREDVQAFHERYYVASNAVVAIVGDLDRAGAEALAAKLIGGLPAGQSVPRLPEALPVATPKVIRIPYPASQSHIFIGQIGISRGDPDYYSLYLGNHVLGGNGLVSELAEEVREKRGLSYSVYSYFLPLRRSGPFLMGLQTRNEQTEEAVGIAKATLENFVRNGPTSDELEAARQNITGGFALRIDSNRKIVQYLATIGFYDLPLDYLQTFTEKIEEVSLQRVTDAFRRRVHPNRLITVIVGG